MSTTRLEAPRCSFCHPAHSSPLPCMVEITSLTEQTMLLTGNLGAIQGVKTVRIGVTSTSLLETCGLGPMVQPL